jgi:hypothetical protein
MFDLRFSLKKKQKLVWVVVLCWMGENKRGIWWKHVSQLHNWVSLYRLKVINANNDKNNYMIIYS